MGEISVLMVALSRWMEGGAGPQAHPVAPALAHDLRLFQMQLVQRGHHDAVAGGLHLLDGAAYLLVLPLCLGKADDAGHQAGLVADLQAGGLPQDFVEDVRLQLQLQMTLPVASCMLRTRALLRYSHSREAAPSATSFIWVMEAA